MWSVRLTAPVGSVDRRIVSGRRCDAFRSPSGSSGGGRGFLPPHPPSSRRARSSDLIGAATALAAVLGLGPGLACTFDPNGQPRGFSVDGPAPWIDAQTRTDGTVAPVPDGPPGPDAARAPDARPGTPDAPLAPSDALSPRPDAALPPDAPPSACDLAATPLALDGAWVEGTTVGAADAYTPSCQATDSRERLFAVDVTGSGAPSDLVVEVEATTGTFDPILDVTTACGDPTTAVACADVSGSGNAEVVSVPAAAGRHYVAVDGFGGTGPFRVRAWLRPLVGPGAGCDRTVEQSRCGAGTYCFDHDDSGGSTCQAVLATPDPEGNGDPCTTPHGPYAADFVFAGEMIDGGSVEDWDVMYLVPATAGRIAAVVTSPEGACNTDTRLQLSRGNCSSPTWVAEDDNGGLGPCPGLVSPTLNAGAHYYLSVSRAVDYRTGPYVLVVDFIPPP